MKNQFLKLLYGLLIFLLENLTDTRVMIFTQYRDSVQEIVDLLNQYQPTVKAMSFIGQASKSISSVGFSQKQQLKVRRRDMFN